MLGLVTICGYGAWYYSFGVLLDPIIVDTGWREATLAASFSVGIAIIGLGSMLGGRLLDRVGSRWVFGSAAVIGGGSLLIASFATSVGVFFVASAVGMGTFGALGFYHITMTTAVRLHPDDSARAIATLTIWGALSSPIYVPLSAFLVQDLGWRTTVRILALSAMVAFVLGVLFVPTRTDREVPVRIPLRSVARSAIATPEARAFTLAVAMVGMAISVILTYQVPVMLAAGLPLGTASFMAGFRGFAQLGGRIPLSFLVRRLGARGALLLSLCSVLVGTGLLSVAGSVPMALLFAVVAGFGLGAYSPLQGIYAADLFEHESLGATMGMYTTISQLGGSIGPFLAGLIAEATGDRRWVVLLAGTAAVGSVVAMVSSRPAQQTVT